MKSSHTTQSATSLQRAPRDEESSRSSRYLVTMLIRMVCLILMVVITPYGWYTWLFGAAAIFLPYIAVVAANVGSDTAPETAVSPDRQLEAPRQASAGPTAPVDPHPVLRIAESPRPAESGHPPTA